MQPFIREGLLYCRPFPQAQVPGFEVAQAVEYQLTEDGRRLQPVVAVMQEFGLWLKAR